MDLSINFTSSPVSFLHLDINSCFATIEQQANPGLRHKPVAVVARLGPSGCVLAASYEAKALGISTGTRLQEALSRCPTLNVLLPDPDKYRFVHQQLKKLLLTYTHLVTPWSIDEFNLDLTYNQELKQDLFEIAKDIKLRLKEEIGEYITVSIGLAPNSYLAKIAASLQKPNGLKVINKDNFISVYSSLKITDLCGISHQLATRLYSVGITSVVDLYYAPLQVVRSALGATAAQYWRLRLRGFQVALVDKDPKSFGHSFVLPKALPFKQTTPILEKLLQKACFRLRKKNFQAKGLSVYLRFKDGPSWGRSTCLEESFFDDHSALSLLKTLLKKAPKKPLIKATALTLSSISPNKTLQLTLFSDRIKQTSLTNAVDKLNSVWGGFAVGTVPTFFAEQSIPDSIGFGRIKELL